jgi:uncharacterized Zn-finger protein
MTAVTDDIVPHFHNEPGVPVIVIGAKKFMCIGALPPQDHPHVFCDMGDDLADLMHAKHVLKANFCQTRSSVSARVSSAD